MAKKNKPNLEKDPVGDKKFLEDNLAPNDDSLTSKLSEYMEKVWQQHQKDFKPTRKSMIDTQRRVRGEYTPEKLQAIQAFKGAETYIRSAENKARAAVSWIEDIYRGDTSPAWTLEPTAIPDLPDKDMEEIKAKTQEIGAVYQQQLLEETGVENQAQIADMMNEFYQQEVLKGQKEIEKTAKERNRVATKQIQDQNQEGGWDQAFKDFLHSFVRMKFGVMKGPILTNKTKMEWAPVEGQSLPQLIAVDKLVNDIYAVSPFMFYPSLGMKDINNGDVIEIHELTKQSLYDLIGVPGYDEEQLKIIIAKFEAGKIKSKWFTIEDELDVKNLTKRDRKNPTTMDDPKNIVLAQEFYGTVSGKLLLEWGYDKKLKEGAEPSLDPNMQYQANIWRIEKHVFKAVLNPDPLGRKPYHVSSWAKNPDWIIGEGMIEFVAPVEDAMNAIARALINNIAIASGPMAEVDKDRVDTRTPIYPWRQIESTSRQMKTEGPAVNYYQPQMHAQELILAYGFFSKLLDEMTVPAYAQGASQAGVTTGTATVFTQLLAAASRSIKAVVSNIDDDIITPFMQMVYDYNLQQEGTSSMGDAQVVAKGVAGLQAKEQQAQRKVEFLQVAANPTFQEILGVENIAAVLAQVARTNDIDLPDIARLEGSPDLQAAISEMLKRQTGVDPVQENGQMANGGGAAANAQGMNPDGSKAGVVNTP